MTAERPHTRASNILTGMFFVFISVLILAFSGSALAQEEEVTDDSTKVRNHSPVAATIMSAVLPGAGQVYNRKYWKVPIVYAGLGTLGYLAVTNGKRYTLFRDGLAYLQANDTIEFYTVEGTPYTLNGLEAGKDYFRRYRDMFAIFTFGFYILNIVDANVDAHLYDFDISDDLSMRVAPDMLYIGKEGVPGVRICLSHKKSLSLPHKIFE